MGLTQRELADAIHVPYQRVNDLVNGRRGMTPSTALRLAKYFGTTPAFWMNLQLRWDLYFCQQEEQKVLEGIETHQRPLAGDLTGRLLLNESEADPHAKPSKLCVSSPLGSTTHVKCQNRGPSGIVMYAEGQLDFRVEL